MSSFKIPILGSLFESIAAEFKDKVKPVPGSVLRCDLAFGSNFAGGTLCHTGIYLGDDKIVEITNVEKKAKIQIVDPYDFLNGQGTNFVRTGINIYVATDGCGNALGSPEIAARANAYKRQKRKSKDYDLVFNNCHMFTVRCITGEKSDAIKLTERDIEEALKDVFDCDEVTWEPTGYGMNSISFDD